MWSFSGSQIFRNCQRQWFYKEHFANQSFKEPARREAYLLSKLQSVEAWRGHIVDYSISNDVLPTLQKGWKLNAQRILERARNRFDSQLEFALRHPLREPGISLSDEDFVVFYALEYGRNLCDADFSRAWGDVELALTNLFTMDRLLNTLKSATALISQRPLTFPLQDVTVKAIPDLIAFFEPGAPLIVDWKVHTFASKEYRLQLACYALALSRCKLQKGFPASLENYFPTDFRLVEAQLLTGELRDYSLSSEDIDAVESYIFDSAQQMLMALGENSNADISPFDLPPTEYPDVCQRCRYRSLCWKGESPWDLKQMSLL